MAWDRQRDRDTVSAEIAKAERERDRIQGLHDDLDKAGRELSAAKEAVSAADQGMEQAAETERRERDCLETARKHLAELESGDAQQKRTIRKQEIENLRLKNKNRRTEVERVKADASGGSRRGDCDATAACGSDGQVTAAHRDQITRATGSRAGPE